MSTSPNPDAAWPRILDALAARDFNALHDLLWPRAASQDWYDSMAPMIENAASGYEKSDPALAIFCYEQARSMYLSYIAGATSGGEGMAMMQEADDHGLGRKIWLLKDSLLKHSG